MASVLRAINTGQNPNRFWVDDDTGNMAGVTASHAHGDGGGGGDITAGQKMISATSGSLLTSLLGASRSPVPCPLVPERLFVLKLTTSETYSHPPRRRPRAAAVSTRRPAPEDRSIEARPHDEHPLERRPHEPWRDGLLPRGFLLDQQCRDLSRCAEVLRFLGSGSGGASRHRLRGGGSAEANHQLDDGRPEEDCAQ